MFSHNYDLAHFKTRSFKTLFRWIFEVKKINVYNYYSKYGVMLVCKAPTLKEITVEG